MPQIIQPANPKLETRGCHRHVKSQTGYSSKTLEFYELGSYAEKNCI
jgi:hypothetical protein